MLHHHNGAFVPILIPMPAFPAGSLIVGINAIDDVESIEVGCCTLVVPPPTMAGLGAAGATPSVIVAVKCGKLLAIMPC